MMQHFTPTMSATILGRLSELILANFGQKGLNFANEVSGIPTGVSALQSAFIPETSAMIFVEAAARLSGEHQLGLLLSPNLSINDYGILTDYCREAETLGTAFERFIRVMPFHSSSNIMALQPFGDKVKLTYKYATAGAPSYDQMVYSTIGTQINYIREFTDPNWLPDEIGLDIPKPRITSLLEQLYPCPVIFDAPEFSLTFSRELLNLKPNRRRSLRPITIADVRRSRITLAPSSLLDVMTNIIRSQMQHSKVNMDGASRIMGFSNRKLQRDLDQFGISFRKLTTRVRVGLAKELLQETGMSLNEIAIELGYSSHSHFTRAFHNETNITPSQFRLNCKNLNLNHLGRNF